MMTLRFSPEDEWHGELHVEANYFGFSGVSSAWFNTADLTQFAERLRLAYADNRVERGGQIIALEVGHHSDELSSAKPLETHFSIRLTPNVRHGRWQVEIQLAEPDKDVLSQSATLRFRVEPTAVLMFAHAIDAMLVSKVEQATLHAASMDRAPAECFRVRFPIQRPLSPFYIGLEQRFFSLLEALETEGYLPKSLDVQLTSETLESFTGGWILARLDWQQARLCLRVGLDAGTNQKRDLDSAIERAFDLAELKQAAIALSNIETVARNYFDSYVLFLLHRAQGRGGEFFRDGPTDDIPYQRYGICVQGIARLAKTMRINDLIFSYLDPKQVS